MKRIPHNKFSTSQIREWGNKNNIELLDPEYVNRTFKHLWFCKKHKEEHIAAFDKIRTRGQLKCCSLANTANVKMKLVQGCCEKYHISLVGEYKDSQTPTRWRCNTHLEDFINTRHCIEHSRGKPPCCRAGKHGDTLEHIQQFAISKNMVFWMKNIKVQHISITGCAMYIKLLIKQLIPSCKEEVNLSVVLLLPILELTTPTTTTKFRMMNE